MVLEIIFLGTGAGMPAKHRNVTSIALKHLSDGSIWLFDCGEATQQQILHTSLKPRKIKHIFITHLHGDHIFGLPGLLGSRSFLGGEESLTIYGPEGIREFIEISLKISQTHLKYDLQIVELYEGVIFENEHFLVQAGLLEHAVPSYGFRIIEKDKPGTLQVEKLKALGIPPGPIYKRIKNGETVTLDDGRVIHGKDFLGPVKKGRIVVILGDTRYCEKSVELAKNADLLIHEATFDAASQDMAHEYYHSTTKEAALVAKRAGAKKLCMTHISSRFEKKDLPALVKEAREIFPNTVIARDFKKISLPMKQS